MTSSILKNEGHRVSIYDINSLIFEEKFLLRKYWKYFLLDAPADIEDEFFNLTKEVFQHYASQIVSSGPQAVIFKIIGKTYSNAVEMARIIKERYADKIIIFTGALLASREDVDSFTRGQDEQPFDYIICGEDELALPELIRSLDTGSLLSLKKEKKVIDCTSGPTLENLDNLPHYDFSDFNLNAYKFPDKLEIFISKGCPWHCGFCVDWLTEKRYRSMSGERIYREVLFQSKRHKVKHFRFCDKTINGDIKAINDFCDLVIAEHERTAFSTEWSGDAMIRPEMTKELLLKMRRAGCVGLGYGLESGSDRVVKDMGKQFSIKIAEEVIRNTHAADIYTSINIMIGFPSETKADFQETLSFISRNKEFMREIRLTYIGCRVLRHSLLYNFPDKFNLAETDTDFWMTKDRENTYEERVRRYELICRYILDLGIELRVNSRVTKKVVKAE